MPFDGSGNYTRDHTWASDAASGIKIKADIHDTHDQDMANAIGQMIHRGGLTSPTANINWGAKKITNLAAGTAGTDAVNLTQLQAQKSFPTAIEITGSAPESFLKYTGATGPWGDSYVTADLAFGVSGTTWVWNDKANFSGTNVMALAENSVLTLTSIDAGAGAMPVMSLDRRSPSPAVNDVVGLISFSGLNSAAAGKTYAQIYPQLSNVTSGAEVSTIYITQMSAGAVTVRMSLHPTGVNVVGNLYSDNVSMTGGVVASTNGNILFRQNGLAVTTNQATLSSNGDLSVGGSVFSTASFIGSGVNAILAPNSASGAVFLRPGGAGSGTGQWLATSNGYLTGYMLETTGNVISRGYRDFAPDSGTYGTQVHSFFWNSANMCVYTGGSFLGVMTITSDYRIKKDVVDLPSTWDQVKALRPVKYTQAAFSPPMSDQAKTQRLKDAITAYALAHGIPEDEVDEREALEEAPPTEIFTEDEVERWSFIAHEAQATLIPWAATGEKDMVDGAQSLNWAPILAAVVKALQEAMTRIETLEGAPA